MCELFQYWRIWDRISSSILLSWCVRFALGVSTSLLACCSPNQIQVNIPQVPPPAACLPDQCHIFLALPKALSGCLFLMPISFKLSNYCAKFPHGTWLSVGTIKSVTGSYLKILWVPDSDGATTQWDQTHFCGRVSILQKTLENKSSWLCRATSSLAVYLLLCWCLTIINKSFQSSCNIHNSVSMNHGCLNVYLFPVYCVLGILPISSTIDSTLNMDAIHCLKRGPLCYICLKFGSLWLLKFSWDLSNLDGKTWKYWHKKGWVLPWKPGGNNESELWKQSNENWKNL